MAHYRYEDIGIAVASNWGIGTPEGLDQLISGLSPEKEMVCLLSAILVRLNTLDNVIVAPKRRAATRRALRKYRARDNFDKALDLAVVQAFYRLEERHGRFAASAHTRSSIRQTARGRIRRMAQEATKDLAEAAKWLGAWEPTIDELEKIAVPSERCTVSRPRALKWLGKDKEK